MSSLFWSSKEEVPEQEEETTEIVKGPKQADINVFTVASGHLYEVSQFEMYTNLD